MRAHELLNDHSQEPQWQQIIRKLQALPYANAITVFGSVARGEARKASDVDVFVDGVPTGLMKIANQHRDMLDPFYIEDGVLMVRNDTSTGWIRAKNAKALMANVVKDGIPLMSISLPASVSEGAKRIAVWSGATITVLHNPTRQQFDNFAEQHRAIRGLLANEGRDIWVWDAGMAVHSNLIQELGLPNSTSCIAFTDGKWSGPVHDREGYYPAVERATPYRETAFYKRQQAKSEETWQALMADPDFVDLMKEK